MLLHRFFLYFILIYLYTYVIVLYERMVNNMTPLFPEKIENTPEVASMLKQLRLNNPKDDKVLTAEELSIALEKNRAWVSQIESRRLKNVKSEDVLKMYIYLLNEDMNSATARLNSFWETYSSQKEELDKIINLFSSTVTSHFFSLESATEKKKLVDVVTNLAKGINFRYDDTINVLDGMDFTAFSQMSSKEKNDFISSFTEIKQKFYICQKRRDLGKIQYWVSTLIYHKNHIKSKPEFLTLSNRCLSQLSQFFNNNMPDDSRIHSRFIATLNKFSENMYIFSYTEVPYNIFKQFTLSFDCTHDDIANAIHALREYIDYLNCNLLSDTNI